MSAWRQLQADIYNKPIVMTNATEGPAYGVALLAGVGTGAFKSVGDACKRSIKQTEKIAPNRKLAARYEQLFPIYDRLYGRLKEESLRDKVLINFEEALEAQQEPFDRLFRAVNLFAAEVRRAADEADTACRKVINAAEKVGHFMGVGIGVQRIDGEIAPCRILPPVGGVGDGRTAAVRADVAAQGGDFDRPSPDHRRDRAMVYARGHSLYPGGLQALHHLLRLQRRGDVEIIDGKSKQSVAHRAADIAGKALFRPQRGEQAVKAGPVAPIGVRQ